MANKGILDRVLKIVTKIRVLSSQKLCSIGVFLNSFATKGLKWPKLAEKYPILSFLREK